MSMFVAELFGVRVSCVCVCVCPLRNVYICHVNDLEHSNNIFHFFSQRFVALTAGRNDLFGF